MDKIKKKKFSEMISYSVGDMVGGGIGMVISTYYFTFLIMVMGLDPLLASLVTAIGKIWDGVTDPVMGIIVDRTKTKIGASRPWLLIGVLPLFITYFMLWYSFGISSQIGMFIYFSLAYILYSTAFTIIVVPYEALLPKIVDSYQERTNYSSMRMIFSGIACIATTYIYEYLVPAENPSSQNIPNFMWLGIILGIFFAIPPIITFFGTKEKLNDVKQKQITLKGVFSEYKEVLENKIYRKYYILTLFGAFVSSAISASMVMFIYLVYGNIQNFFLSFTLVFCVINLKGAVEIGFFVPNVILMKKYNKHKPYILDLPLIVISSIIIMFINQDSPVWMYLIASCFLGAGVSCLAFVPQTLLPDLSDVDELISGERREGVNAGLNSMGRKIVGGLSLTLFGLILKAFGLEAGNVSNDQATTMTIFAVKVMLSIVPIICCIFMVLISKSYNLDAKSHNLIKSLIKAKKELNSVEINNDDKIYLEQLTGYKYNDLWISKQ